MIYFGNTGSLMIGIIAALFIIGMSVWAKTGVLVTRYYNSFSNIA